MASKATFVGAKGLLCGRRSADAGQKGYATKANNVLIGSDGVYEPIFATAQVGSLCDETIDRMFQERASGSVMRAAFASGDYRMELYDVSTPDTWVVVDNTRAYTSTATFNETTYMLSSTGLRRLSDDGTTTYSADIPEGRTLKCATTGSSGFLSIYGTIGYVCVWGRPRSVSTNSFYLGAPSERSVVQNTGATTCNVSITASIPPDVTTTSHFLQVYRTRTALPAEGTTASIDPGSTYVLVYEAYPTSSQISAGVVTFTDSVLDGNGTYDLYTSVSIDGANAAAFPCEATSRGDTGYGELAVWDKCLWATNYNPRPYIDLSVLRTFRSIGGYTFTFTNGLNTATGTSGGSVGQVVVSSYFAAGFAVITSKPNPTSYVFSANANATGVDGSALVKETLQLGTSYLWPHSTESATNLSFLTPSSGVPTYVIRELSLSLCRIINTSSTLKSKFLARYMSGPNDQPGLIRITQIDRTLSAQYMQLARDSAASGDDIPVSPSLLLSTPLAASAPRATLVHSGALSETDGNPEGWPLRNSFSFPSQPDILSVAPLRGALMLICPFAVYRVTGTYGSYSVDMVDASRQFWASDTNPGRGCVVHNNVAYAMSTAGLVKITESSVRLVANTPEELVGEADPPGRMYAHETMGLIFIPGADRTYIYHVAADAWTTSDIVVGSSGAFRSSDLTLYTSSGQYSRAQRSAQLEASSYYQTSSAYTITGVSGNTITLSSSAGLSVGDVLVQGSVSAAIMTLSPEITLSDGTGFANGAATGYLGFNAEVEYAPLVSPLGNSKTFESGALIFDSPERDPSDPDEANDTGLVRYITIGTKTDLYLTEDSTIHTPTSSPLPQAQRFTVGSNTRRGSVLVPRWQIRVAGNKFRVVGMDVNVTTAGTMVGR